MGNVLFFLDYPGDLEELYEGASESSSEINQVFPIIPNRVRGFKENIHKITHLEPSCLSCGSQTNLTSCQDCSLVHACEAHNDPEVFSKHARSCRQLATAERSLEFWRERYQATIGTDPYTYSSTSMDGRLRRSVLDHDENDCRRPECLSKMDENRSDSYLSSISPRRLRQLGASPNWCPSRLYCQFFELAAKDLMIVLQQLANDTLSGAALCKAIQHWLWMLRQDMGMAYSLFDHYFLLSFRFNGFDQAESYYYNYLRTSPIMSQVKRSLLQNVLLVEAVREPGLSMLHASGVDEDISTQTYGDILSKLRIYLNSPDGRKPVKHSIENLRLEVPVVGDTTYKQVNWKGDTDAPLHFFVLLLRAMSDLRSIQRVPEAVRHILPPELVVEVQKQTSANPILLGDQGLQATIALGRDCEPYMRLLEQVAKGVFDTIEKDKEFFKSSLQIEKQTYTYHGCRSLCPLSALLTVVERGVMFF